MTAHRDRLDAPLDDDDLTLAPLAERHRAPLRDACAQDRLIWEIYPVLMLGEHFDRVFDAVLADAGRIAFAIHLNDRLIGTSGFLHIVEADGVVEIGSTYILPDMRGTGVNARIKRLMIERAFASGFQRVEFRVDTRNKRSMAAVMKLGARHEGTLRRNRVTWTGYVRDTAVFGLLMEEWQR
jgi:RimJ/RimL family protein N-acetyltransferase